MIEPGASYAQLRAISRRLGELGRHGEEAWGLVVEIADLKGDEDYLTSTKATQVLNTLYMEYAPE